jgi:hypothetical protein
MHSLFYILQKTAPKKAAYFSKIFYGTKLQGCALSGASVTATSEVLISYSIKVNMFTSVIIIFILLLIVHTCGGLCWHDALSKFHEDQSGSSYIVREV